MLADYSFSDTSDFEVGVASDFPDFALWDERHLIFEADLNRLSDVGHDFIEILSLGVVDVRIRCHPDRIAEFGDIVAIAMALTPDHVGRNSVFRYQ